MQYDVYHNYGQGKVAITRTDYGPQNVFGQVYVGSFELDVDERNNLVSKEDLSSFDSNDHILIRAAKKVLTDADVKNPDKLIFLDQASNAPTHGNGVPEEEVEYSEPGSDPDYSNQKGGLGSTAGTTPDETLPNGVTDVEQDEAAEQEQADTADKGTAPGAESADRKKDVDPADETAADLIKRIQLIVNREELQDIYDAELNGKERTTVITAIEKRANDLENADNGK